ncbi:aspartate kinase [Thermoplasma sp.]|uniref:aspartate kinase n=1 Tax=Thermoplasma sp. TaxID=1973142 RepID=UPI001274DB56|nr:aspartate kinase [Thermoplasma sp.]KAA8923512.1 MAG: aspartate kinase [Thermoplasma sp.]
MTKASDAVKGIINSNNIYTLLLNTGLVNYTKLAREIKSQVDFLTGKKVKINTIVKALTNIEIKAKPKDVLLILKQSILTLEYNYKEITTENRSDIPDDAILVIKESNGYSGIIKTTDGNSLVIAKILLPPGSCTTAGITLLITEFLEINGVSVRNIYRLSKEIWIIVDSESAGKAADALNRLLYKSSDKESSPVNLVD